MLILAGTPKRPLATNGDYFGHTRYEWPRPPVTGSRKWVGNVAAMNGIVRTVECAIVAGTIARATVAKGRHLDLSPSVLRRIDTK